MRLPAWSHKDRIQRLIRGQSPLPELDPQLFLNQGVCNKPSHIAHQPLAAQICWDSGWTQVLATNQAPPGRVW